MIAVCGVTYLVTGAAGFIGHHVCRALLERGERVAGLDNLSDYYDPRLKEARLRQLSSWPGFSFTKADVATPGAVAELCAAVRPERLIHLAAQTGVRHSLKVPRPFVETNLLGFVEVLEACRKSGVGHLVYASSSSVYGGSARQPFSVRNGVDHPLSLYAATKRANELLAHAHSHAHGLPTTGLRFFSVYGPWGRPDMVMHLFAEAILEGRPIDVFDEGKCLRDFTYVDDVVEGVLLAAAAVPRANPDWNAALGDPSTSAAPYRIYNVGNSSPVELLRMIEVLERHLGRKAVMRLLPAQPGDIPASCADMADMERDLGFKPRTPLEEGIARFVAWFKEYRAT